MQLVRSLDFRQYQIEINSYIVVGRYSMGYQSVQEQGKQDSSKY
jgi:hypothetical protein